MFPHVVEAIGKMLPIERLRYVAFSHFEADECGSLNDFLAVAPTAIAVCGAIAAGVSVNDIAARPPRARADGEVLRTGQHAFKWLDAPHVPHGWECGQPEVLACMHGSAWHGDGAALLRALARSLARPAGAHAVVPDDEAALVQPSSPSRPVARRRRASPMFLGKVGCRARCAPLILRLRTRGGRVASFARTAASTFPRENRQ
jgi:hypothetical protein